MSIAWYILVAVERDPPISVASSSITYPVIMQMAWNGKWNGIKKCRIM